MAESDRIKSIAFRSDEPIAAIDLLNVEEDDSERFSQDVSITKNSLMRLKNLDPTNAIRISTLYIVEDHKFKNYAYSKTDPLHKGKFLYTSREIMRSFQEGSWKLKPII